MKVYKTRLGVKYKLYSHDEREEEIKIKSPNGKGVAFKKGTLLQIKCGEAFLNIYLPDKGMEYSFASLSIHSSD
jgi:hypothetical protein